MPIKYTKEILQEAAKKSYSVKALLQALGKRSYSGSNANHIVKRLAHYGIDISHFRTGRKGMPSHGRKGAECILHKNYTERAPTYQLRRALLEEGVPHKCQECGQGSEWNGKELVLPIDHIDGNYLNNTKDNLRFLCPNCHSQTPTYGRRSKLPVYASGEAAGLSRQ